MTFRSTILGRDLGLRTTDQEVLGRTLAVYWHLKSSFHTNE